MYPGANHPACQSCCKIECLIHQLALLEDCAVENELWTVAEDQNSLDSARRSRGFSFVLNAHLYRVKSWVDFDLDQLDVVGCNVGMLVSVAKNNPYICRATVHSRSRDFFMYLSRRC